jgi:hypothetical protein
VNRFSIFRQVQGQVAECPSRTSGLSRKTERRASQGPPKGNTGPLRALHQGPRVASPLPPAPHGPAPIWHNLGAFVLFDTKAAPPSPLRDVRYPCLSKSSRTQGRAQNRFAKSIDSYRLATKGLPPPGHIIVHDLPNPAPSAHGGESPARSRQTLPRPTAGLFRRTLPATPGQTPRLDGLEDARHGR